MPSAGDHLSLGKLGRAVGTNGDYTSTMRLAADGRGSGAETKLSQFYISAVGDVTVPDETPNESTSATATLAFTNAGSLFLTKIANRTQNFVTEQGELKYSISKQFQYENKELPFSIDFKRRNPLKEGEYIAEVYIDGFLAGISKFYLK